jgi:hypothetical protein
MFFCTKSECNKKFINCQILSEYYYIVNEGIISIISKIGEMGWEYKNHGMIS